MTVVPSSLFPAIKMATRQVFPCVCPGASAVTLIVDRNIQDFSGVFWRLNMLLFVNGAEQNRQKPTLAGRKKISIAPCAIWTPLETSSTTPIVVVVTIQTGKLRKRKKWTVKSNTIWVTKKKGMQGKKQTEIVIVAARLLGATG